MDAREFVAHLEEIGVLGEVTAIAAYHGARVVDLCGASRLRHISWARQDTMLFMRENFKAMSLTGIGRMFGRDHTTVMLSIEKAKERREDVIRTRVGDGEAGSPGKGA